MQKITTFLWFDGRAEEAANHYTSIFKNSRIADVTRIPEGAPLPPGVMTVAFELEGSPFVALNGGPEFAFNESISFLISCETQDEVDEYWEKLTADGGEPGPCGWLKDKFGVSWQVIPTALQQLMSDPDPEKAARVGIAMREMSKIDIQGLRDAHAG